MRVCRDEERKKGIPDRGSCQATAGYMGEEGLQGQEKEVCALSQEGVAVQINLPTRVNDPGAYALLFSEMERKNK